MCKLLNVFRFLKIMSLINLFNILFLNILGIYSKHVFKFVLW